MDLFQLLEQPSDVPRSPLLLLHLHVILGVILVYGAGHGHETSPIAEDREVRRYVDILERYRVSDITENV